MFINNASDFPLILDEMKKNKEDNTERNRRIEQYALKVGNNILTFFKREKMSSNITSIDFNINSIVYEIALNDDNFSKLKKNIANLEAFAGVNDLTFDVIGENKVNLYVPRPERDILTYYQAIRLADQVEHNYLLPFVAGVDANYEPIIIDLASAPHLLVAGASGSGKSVLLNSIICSLTRYTSSNNLKFIMIDTKCVELTLYNQFKKYVPLKAYTDSNSALNALKSTNREVIRRYKLFNKLKAKNIQEYNSKVKADKTMPYMVIVIDEAADLMTEFRKETETEIVKLCQLSRACGIHLIMATQRPDSKTITGLIKANIPTRIALATASNADSITIIGNGQASKLLGKGDFLLQKSDSMNLVRGQAPFLTSNQIVKIMKLSN